MTTSGTQGAEPTLEGLSAQVGTLNGNVERLTESLGDFVTQDDLIERLEARQNSQRRLLIGLAVSVLLDILLSVGLGLLALNARTTTATLQRAQRQAVNACQAGNEARAVEQQLWTYVLTLSAEPPKDLTPDQAARAQQQVAQFKQYLTTTFAPRSCTTGGTHASATHTTATTRH